MSQTNQTKVLPGFTVILGPNSEKYLVPDDMVEATEIALEKDHVTAGPNDGVSHDTAFSYHG